MTTSGDLIDPLRSDPMLAIVANHLASVPTWQGHASPRELCGHYHIPLDTVEAKLAYLAELGVISVSEAGDCDFISDGRRALIWALDHIGAWP